VSGTILPFHTNQSTEPMTTNNLYNYDAAYAPSSCYQILNIFKICTLFMLTYLTQT